MTQSSLVVYHLLMKTHRTIITLLIALALGLVVVLITHPIPTHAAIWLGGDQGWRPSLLNPVTVDMGTQVAPIQAVNQIIKPEVAKSEAEDTKDSLNEQIKELKAILTQLQITLARLQSK